MVSATQLDLAFDNDDWTAPQISSRLNLHREPAEIANLPDGVFPPIHHKVAERINYGLHRLVDLFWKEANESEREFGKVVSRKNKFD